MLSCMQASDLQKLLEMYAGWQKRIFPHVSFDDFIGELESMGKSYVLKVQHVWRQPCLG